MQLSSQRSPGRSQAAQASANLISRGHGCLSREAPEYVTVLTKEPRKEPGRASKCKPNFPRAGLPLKGDLKVCDCRGKGDLGAGRPRKQVQT